jgi:hypothetical protein
MSLQKAAREFVLVLTCRDRATSVTKSARLARLYSYDTLLERLAQDLRHVAFELGQFIQEAHAVVRQRHVARHQHLAVADQADIPDGVMGTTRARVTNAVQALVRPAKGGMRVVSRASVGGSTDRKVAGRRGCSGGRPAVRWAWGTMSGLLFCPSHVYRAIRRMPPAAAAG